MSATKRYPLSAMRTVRSVRAGNETISGRLASSDVPASVDVVGDGCTVRLALNYPFATEEPQEWTAPHGAWAVRFAVGRHSKRLFAVEFTVDAARYGLSRQQARSLARELRDEIRKALGDLERSAERAGPRMNYAAAGEGLELEDDDTPPAWLIDALGAMREGRHSDPGRKS